MRRINWSRTLKAKIQNCAFRVSRLKGVKISAFLSLFPSQNLLKRKQEEKGSCNPRAALLAGKRTRDMIIPWQGPSALT